MQSLKKKRCYFERGDTILEFTAALPLFLLLIGGIAIFAWAFWAQAAADIAASRAVNEGSFNQGGDSISPAIGSSSFQRSMGFLTGDRTAGVVGEPIVSASESQHMVQFHVIGSIQLLFGPLDSLFKFGGGGAGRMWRFWPGPPSPWE